MALYSAAFLVFVGALRAAHRLHNILLASIFRKPQSFFDTTPLGRVLARFSADLDTLDSRIASFLRGALLTACRVKSFSIPLCVNLLLGVSLLARFIFFVNHPVVSGLLVCDE